MTSREALTIKASARKHGIQDEDIRHAFEHPIRVFVLDDGFRMLVGPALSGALIEVGELRPRGRRIVVIHAMHARHQFLR